MSEFVDVMKMAKQMCAHTDDCNDCPIYDSLSEYCKLGRPIFSSDSDFAKYESTIMEWATGNPETRYPTWQEWHSMNFPDADDYITPCDFMPRQKVEALMGKKCIDLDCSQCTKLPIPTDIAKKLGVQPITKANDTTTKEASQ